MIVKLRELRQNKIHAEEGMVRLYVLSVVAIKLTFC